MNSMLISRFHLHLIIAACLVMLPCQVRAQGTAPAGDQARTATPAKSERHELKIDGVSATVTVLRTGRPFPAGGSAFAQIKLKNTGKTKLAGAELLLETERAVIRDVSGGAVTVREDGPARIASIKKIAKGRPRTILVEVGLGEAVSGSAQSELQNILKVTLRQPGGAGETATLGWKVANCAGGFYAQIVKVREGSGAGIAGAIKAARSKDKSRPGRWLFPPRFKTANAARKCVSRAKRWSKRRGRNVIVCTKYETIEAVAAGKVAVVKSERGIYRFASRYVSARATDRELSLTRDSGWAANRVSQNLRGFLNQRSNPAICTGAIPYLDYFGKRLEGFVKRAKTFDEMAGKSWSLAQLRTSEAIEAAKAEGSGHPGWGSAPLDLPQGENKASLKNWVETLAQLTNDPQAGQSVKEAENAFDALRAMSAYFGGEAAKSLPAPTRSALTRALSAIEAAEYIGTVNRHYADLRHALLGSMSTIRQAHANNCTCGG